MSLYHLVQEKRDEIIRIAAEHGASNVRILGLETEDDDEIDFLVDLEPKRTIFDLGGLLADLHDLLEPMDQQDFAAYSLAIPKVNVLVEPGPRISPLEEPLREYIAQREAIPL